MTNANRLTDIAPPAIEVANARFWESARRAIWMGLAAHVVFGVIFLAFGVPVLALVNVGSVAIYAVILKLLQQRRQGLASVLVWLEILGHAALASRFVGFESGFQYYAAVIMLLIFLGTPRRVSLQLLQAGILITIVIVADIVLHDVPPLVTLSHAKLDWLRRFNVVSFLSALGFLVLFYAQTVDQIQRHLHAMATTDTLTGLTNRRQLIEVAEYELSRSMRSAEPLAAIIVDVDRFKEVNDVHGHVSGDDVLAEIARRLMGSVRHQDTVSRWGGEEFLVLLPNTTLAAAAAIAERIRLAVSEKPIETAHALVSLTVTSGVSEWQQGERMETCIARADRALYRGKAAGRNRTELALDIQHTMDTTLELDLRQSA
jgi:diguanylate cyclase (GGDEF)-like protein